MAEVRLRACDICGRHEDTEGIEIEKVNLELGTERARGELCQDDARPIRELMDKLPGAARRRTGRHDFTASMVDDPAQIPRDGAERA